MARSTPPRRLGITIDANLHKGIVAAAKKEGMTVSEWMADAARQALRIRAGLAAVAEWEKENGHFTPEEEEESLRRVVAQFRDASRVRRPA